MSSKKKIRMNLSKADENRLVTEVEHGDSLSVFLILFILVLCLAVGVSLGYFLYKIAIVGAI